MLSKDLSRLRQVLGLPLIMSSQTWPAASRILFAASIPLSASALQIFASRTSAADTLSRS